MLKVILQKLGLQYELNALATPAWLTWMGRLIPRKGQLTERAWASVISVSGAGVKASITSSCESATAFAQKALLASRIVPSAVVR